MSDTAPESEAPVELPIDGVLDLHTFRPQDVSRVVAVYLEACRERGILEVRVIHGKGIGELRRTVQTFLKGSALVASFADANALYGGLGATMVKMRPR
ncbi:MAG: Smr/MutS family protein [Verrucomicrobia bacterium]|nr:Smr/MutS family protein [Verrucomicrobiota bacterium]